MPAESRDRPDADPVPRRFPEGFALSAAALLGAVIVLAAILVGRSLWRDSVELETAGADSTTTTLSPSVTPRPTIGSDTQEPDPDGAETQPESGTDDGDEPDAEGDPIPGITCPESIDPLICDAVSYVEQTRGRPFKTFPNIQLLPDDEFDARVLANFESQVEELESADVVLSALGLLEPDVSYVDLFRDLLEVGVVGVYFIESDELIVRGRELTLHVQNVLVHELTHAFDDQWFDLDREFDDDESAYGYRAVVEGNASRVDDQWRAELSPGDQEQMTREELSTIAPGDLRRVLAIPLVVIRLQSSPYEDGATYVESLIASGGEAAVDAALSEPPTTSEEVLHPRTDRETDPLIEVEVPPAGGEVVAEGRLGELLFRLWLGRVAGEGWGGDSYVAWIDGGSSCLTVDVAADSEADLLDFRAAGEAWAAEQPASRSVSAVDSAPELLRLTGCQQE